MLEALLVRVLLVGVYDQAPEFWNLPFGNASVDHIELLLYFEAASGLEL